jgi:hypothetical protein
VIREPTRTATDEAFVTAMRVFKTIQRHRSEYWGPCLRRVQQILDEWQADRAARNKANAAKRAKAKASRESRRRP